MATEYTLNIRRVLTLRQGKSSLEQRGATQFQVDTNCTHYKRVDTYISIYIYMYILQIQTDFALQPTIRIVHTNDRSG